MRLQRIEFNGLTCYDTPAIIDLDATPAGLVALIGRNGHGKTTALEAAYVSLYRQFATRGGSIYDHCHGHAYVETRWEDQGRQITVRLTIDATKRKAEGHVFIDGQPITDGKLDSFDEAVEEHFGSAALFLAGPFATQTKTGGLLGMKRGERKALFAELLGLGRLEELHSAASGNHSEAGVQLERRRERLVALGYVQEAIVATEADIRITAGEIDQAATELAAAEIAETDAVEDLAKARASAARLGEAEQERQRALARDRDAAMALNAALGEPATIRSRANALRNALAQRMDQAVERATNRYERAAADHARRVAELEQRIAAAPDPDEASAMLDEVIKARQADEKATADRRAIQLRIAEQSATVEQAESQRQILMGQVEVVGRVPCTTDAPPLAETCPLLAGAREASGTIAELSDMIAEATVKQRELEKLLGSLIEPTGIDHGTREQAARQQVARASTVDQLRRDLAVLRGDNSHELLKKDIEEAEAAEKRDRAELKRIDAQEAADLANAEGAVKEAEARRQQAARDLAVATAAVDTIASNRVDRHELALQEARAATAECRNALDETKATAVRLKEYLRMLRHSDEERQRLAGEAKNFTREMGDWRLLADALGRDGIQALLIDAAGPEVSAIANELLGTCFGPRYSIVIETLREKKTGGQAEAFDVVVYDGQVPRRFEDYSPGEQVLIGEAISLAIAIYNARKNAVSYATLWRDETSGALDPQTGAHYPQMLRRALDLGGFHQLLFISHDDYVVEAADAQFRIVHGRIEQDAEAVAA